MITISNDGNDTVNLVLQVATVGSAIGAAASAIFTWRSAKEIKEQREAMYRPELAIDSCVVDIYGNLNLNAIATSKYKRVANFGWEVLNNELSEFILLELQNIGLGSATSISFCWKFDYPLTFKILKEIDDSLTFKNRGMYIQVQGDGFNNFYYPFMELVPLSVNTIPTLKKLPIGMPRIVLMQYLYYFALLYKANNYDTRKYFTEDFKVMPKPVLELTYYDVVGKKHIKTFEFSISATLKSQGDIFAIMSIISRPLPV